MRFLVCRSLVKTGHCEQTATKVCCGDSPGVRIRVMDSAPHSSDSRSRGEPQFATTNWSLILAAGERGNSESNRALEHLCRAYWPLLYASMRRRVGNLHDAQDLTQAFFERLLEKNYLTQADPDRGRLRAWLIAAFRHFLANVRERSRTQKRSGGTPHFSLNFASPHESHPCEISSPC